MSTRLLHLSLFVILFSVHSSSIFLFSSVVSIASSPASNLTASSLQGLPAFPPPQTVRQYISQKRARRTVERFTALRTMPIVCQTLTIITVGTMWPVLCARLGSNGETRAICTFLQLVLSWTSSSCVVWKRWAISSDLRRSWCHHGSVAWKGRSKYS